MDTPHFPSLIQFQPRARGQASQAISASSSKRIWKWLLLPAIFSAGFHTPHTPRPVASWCFVSCDFESPWERVALPTVCESPRYCSTLFQEQNSQTNPKPSEKQTLQDIAEIYEINTKNNTKNREKMEKKKNKLLPEPLQTPPTSELRYVASSPMA